MDGRTFAIDLVRRSHEWAERYVAQEYGRIRARLQARGLIEYCRSLMWREYMIGVHVPAKTLALLPDDAQDLKLLLTRQLLEEWKHSQVFAERVRALGGDGDLARYTPTPGDWELYYGTYNWSHPVELVVSLQCTGEVMITEMFKTLVDPKRLLVDERTAAVIREQILADDAQALDSLVDPETARRLEEDVIPDEGQHIRYGRVILERYAMSAEVQQMALHVQQRKMAALQVSHGDLVDRVLAYDA
ncbi:MAG TPA: hypothetical protein VK881_00945 [bacterium]|nr:hypothetical protein [bacterium]